MTQEDKELLLQDLSARSPYGVKCTTKASGWKAIYSIRGCLDKKIFIDCPKEVEGDDEWLVQNIVPYLRPISSMTKEEKEYLYLKYGIETIDEEVVDFGEFLCEGSPVSLNTLFLFYDWLNKNHFDYRGLISKGLAIAVTKENNPYERK